MQIPVSNLRPDRFHRLVRNCRTEVDEELPLAILRSPRPKGIAQKIELLVRINLGDEKASVLFCGRRGRTGGRFRRVGRDNQFPCDVVVSNRGSTDLQSPTRSGTLRQILIARNGRRKGAYGPYVVSLRDRYGVGGMARVHAQDCRKKGLRRYGTQDRL